MNIKRKWILPYHIASVWIGAVVFLYGFFPITYTNDRRAELKDLPNFIDNIPLNASIYGSHVLRSILMVIDALRADFIQHQQNTSMKYLNKLIHDKAGCLVNLEVEVPTVTMPRIKAMTTGTIPNFIDVVLNLGSSELKMDSLLQQTYDNGGKIIFCGDNTWVKMFPEMFNRKLENQDSFYVNDFDEGDKNITQKLSLELKRDDWELLTLHFLGLDHIGHVEGPFSSKVGPKLKEMDTVIMHIHLAMLDWMKTSEKSPLLLITGDHGMRDSGGHGGSSYSEINVPLVLVGPSCYQNGESFKQIDMTATIAVLLGLPIPAPSIGTIIPNFLQDLSMEQKLYAYFYNGQRLLDKITQFQGIDSVKETVFHTISSISSSFIEEEHQIWYYSSSTVFIMLYLSEMNGILNPKRTDSKKVPQVSLLDLLGLKQLGWILLFIGHLIGRRLNQTGDKWLNVPDIGDCLETDEHRLWDSFFASTSLLLLHISCLDFGSILTNVLTMTACMLIYHYKTLKGSVYFAGIKISESTGTSIFLIWLNIGEIAAINYVPILYKSITSNIRRFDMKIFLGTLFTITTLVITLTHKPHNIFLIPLLLFTCDKINQCCRRLCGKRGNSNSLATIDLNAGYTGQNTFSFSSVAFFLTLNTFSGPILPFLVLIYNVYDCSDQSGYRAKDLVNTLPWITLMITVPFTVYVFIILSFRHHIFIWSVFSPKLLYDFYYLCLMIVMWMFGSIVSTVS